MAQAVILVGLQGSGKTSYYQKHFSTTHVHISRDVLGSTGREAVVLQECLSAGRSFVIDNTNATRAVRAPLIRQAKAAGYQVSAYFFAVAVRTAIGRNNHRQDKRPIPVPAILRTAKQMEPPAQSEGFDEIHTITASVESTNDNPPD